MIKTNMKKRGMEMAITTVIMIVLSISVLTILVIFFNAQTGFLSKWFKTQQTESNVDSIISVCDNLVTSGSVYAYCCEEKEVRFGKKGELVDGEIVKKDGLFSCTAIANADWSGGRVREMDCTSVSCA